MEKREKIEQAVKERERVRLDALPKKWNKREEYEFLRVLTGYGVDLFSGVAVPTPDWSRFRTIAKLERKSDEALSDYYKVFIAMCKRQAGVRLTEEEKGLEGLIEDISEDHARLVLDRLELLSKLKEVGKTSINDERLLLCQNNLDTPDWWESGKHDKELIRAVMKHGLYQSYQNIFTDPEFSFGKSEHEYVAMLEHQWMLAQEVEANKLQAAFYQSSIKKECTESSAVVEEVPSNVKQEPKVEVTETDAVKSEVEGEQPTNEEAPKADEQAFVETAEPNEKFTDTEPIQEAKKDNAADEPIESEAEKPVESSDAEKETAEIESEEKIEETAAPRSPDAEKMETSTEEPTTESVKSPQSPQSPKAETTTTANEQVELPEETKAEETANEKTEEISGEKSADEVIKSKDETAVEQMETVDEKSDEIELESNDTESKEIESEQPKPAEIEESTTTEPSTDEEKMETEETIEQQAELVESEKAIDDNAELAHSEETPMEVDGANNKSEEETTKLAEEAPSTGETTKETADDIQKDAEVLSESNDVQIESTEEKLVEQAEKPPAVESEQEKQIETTEENVEQTPEIKAGTLVEEEQKTEIPMAEPTIVEDIKPALNPMKVEEKKIQEECVILDDDDDDIMIVGKGDPDDDEVMNEKEKQSKQLSELLAKARAKFENPIKVRWFRDFALEQRVSHIVYCIEHAEWPVNKTYSAYAGCQGINLDVPLHETVKHMPGTIDLIGRRSSTPDILAISGAEPSCGKKMQTTSLPMQSPSPQLPKMQLPTMPSSGGKKRKRQHIAIDVETERAKLHALLNSSQGAGLTAAQQAALQGKWPEEDKKDTKLTHSSMQPPPAHQHQSIRSSRSEQQQQAQNYSSKSSVIPGTSSTLTPIDLSSR